MSLDTQLSVHYSQALVPHKLHVSVPPYHTYPSPGNPNQRKYNIAVFLPLPLRLYVHGIVHVVALKGIPCVHVHKHTPLNLSRLCRSAAPAEIHAATESNEGLRLLGIVPARGQLYFIWLGWLVSSGGDWALSLCLTRATTEKYRERHTWEDTSLSIEPPPIKITACSSYITTDHSLLNTTGRALYSIHRKQAEAHTIIVDSL